MVKFRNYRLLEIETNDNDFKSNIKKLYQKNLYKFHKKFVKIKFVKKNTDLIKLYGFDTKLKATYKKFNVEKILKKIESMPMGKLKPVNLSLYEDYNHKTTIKNLGFKDKDKALYTIKKIKNKPLSYQKRVINTMLNRAKYHPNKTKDMEEAIKVFKIWLNKNK
tara:strand:+ start:1844 stop:2335 length:492 start_codon:yes stop_codon:yes gene_type:complete